MADAFYTLSAKTIEATGRVDGWPYELRECVHEFGYSIVQTLLSNGVKNPSAIRQIVTTIWGGARQQSQRQDARNTIDWLLDQSGTGVSAKTLYRLLAQNNLAIVAAEPTRAMLNASMAEVAGHNVLCTKEEKHRRRLRAALRAAMRPEEFQRLPKVSEVA